MKGRERTCKSLIRRSGWNLEDRGRGRAEGEPYRLILMGPGEATMTVDAPSRPIAYRRAARLVEKVAKETGAA